MLGGYFFSAPPLKWRQRGLGEAAGGLCFGFLPVAAGYYLQCGYLVTEVLVYGILLSCAAFNLFLINGFPRPGAQEPAQPGTLAERWGPVAGALIFTLVNILLIAGLAFSLLFPAAPLPFQAGFGFLILLAVVNQELIKRQAYRQEGRLKLLGRLILGQHLAMSLVFIISLWQRL
jgi:1,4-dihydroxy-2-naphthoate octaprenyltransferase